MDANPGLSHPRRPGGVGRSSRPDLEHATVSSASVHVDDVSRIIIEELVLLLPDGAWHRRRRFNLPPSTTQRICGWMSTTTTSRAGTAGARRRSMMTTSRNSRTRRMSGTRRPGHGGGGEAVSDLLALVYYTQAQGQSTIHTEDGWLQREPFNDPDEAFNALLKRWRDGDLGPALNGQ